MYDMVEENLEDREIRVMSEKLKVGILGGTGMVGQRFISPLYSYFTIFDYWWKQKKEINQWVSFSYHLYKSF